MAVAKVKLPAAKSADWIFVSRCLYIPQRAIGNASYSIDISNQYLRGVGGLGQCTTLLLVRLNIFTCLIHLIKKFPPFMDPEGSKPLHKNSSLSQINPLHVLTPNFFQIYFNIILPSTSQK
jgi:hypothetical protein